VFSEREILETKEEYGQYRGLNGVESVGRTTKPAGEGFRRLG